MDTVSWNSLFSITLNEPNIRCDRICEQIQKLITKFNNEHPNTSAALVIRINPIIDSCSSESVILNIEHKPPSV
jgi:hypothetical protein